MAGHRYWRLTNITTRLASHNDGSRVVVEVGFSTLSGKTSNETGKGFTNSNIAGSNADAAFDGNLNTIVHSAYLGHPDYNASVVGLNWYIGYRFDEPQEVTAVSMQMRQDMQPQWGQEWQTADLEYSDNDIDWYKYTTIEPRIPSVLLSLVTVPVVALSTLNVNISPISNYINIYSFDESGSFSGLVTQGKSGEPKLPIKAEVLLYDRMTNKLLQRTWSSDLGAYSFSGLDSGREYYAVSIHPNRTYNAIIQDGLKSGMTA